MMVINSVLKSEFNMQYNFVESAVILTVGFPDDEEDIMDQVSIDSIANRMYVSFYSGLFNMTTIGSCMPQHARLLQCLKQLYKKSIRMNTTAKIAVLIQLHFMAHVTYYACHIVLK